jgi:tetratricopeptide (TPR) repeat protein
MKKMGEVLQARGSKAQCEGRRQACERLLQLGGAEQYQRAQKSFERALTLQSDQIDARIYMANMFTDTGRVEMAVPLLREALKTNPAPFSSRSEKSESVRFTMCPRQAPSSGLLLSPFVMSLNEKTDHNRDHHGQNGACRDPGHGMRVGTVYKLSPI